mgnify:CR=1 FL=1
MKKCLRLLAVTILAFSSLANAQIYKSVDANGVVTFSDKPPAKERGAAEEMNLPTQVNTAQALSVVPAEPEVAIPIPNVSSSLSVRSSVVTAFRLVQNRWFVWGDRV